MKFLAIYPDKIDFSTGLLISILAIIIVFVILYLIILCVQFSTIFFKNKKDKKEDPQPITNTSKKNKEITDEDMMVAALIATIEFKNETNSDAKLVSIKQIN